jgi:hypothetical protein
MKGNAMTMTDTNTIRAAAKAVGAHYRLTKTQIKFIAFMYQNARLAQWDRALESAMQIEINRIESAK